MQRRLKLPKFGKLPKLSWQLPDMSKSALRSSGILKCHFSDEPSTARKNFAIRYHPILITDLCFSVHCLHTLHNEAEKLQNSPHPGLKPP